MQRTHQPETAKPAVVEARKGVRATILDGIHPIPEFRQDELQVAMVAHDEAFVRQLMQPGKIDMVRYAQC